MKKYDELEKAMKVIKDFCNGYECEICPLKYEANACVLMELSPNVWGGYMIKGDNNG